MHELFVSKTRTSEVRASEGFWQKKGGYNPVQSTFYDVSCLLQVTREFSMK